MRVFQRWFNSPSPVVKTCRANWHGDPGFPAPVGAAYNGIAFLAGASKPSAAAPTGREWLSSTDLNG
jgi:hypothetical protein